MATVSQLKAWCAHVKSKIHQRFMSKKSLRLYMDGLIRDNEELIGKLEAAERHVEILNQSISDLSPVPDTEPVPTIPVDDVTRVVLPEPIVIDP